jgi:flagellar motor switch protein FliM
MENQSSSFKRTLLLTPALGDWTTFKPQISEGKIVRSGLYGFDSLSEEQLKKAHLLHYDFFQKFIQSLRKELQCNIQFYCLSVIQQNYGAFIASLTDPIAYLKTKLDNLNQNQIQLILDLPLCDIIINQALGVKEEPKMPARPLTELEETTLKEAVNLTFPVYFDVFKGIPKIPTQFELISSPGISSEPTIGSIESFIIFTAEISIAENKPFKIRLGYLHHTLKYVLNKLLSPGQSAVPLQKLSSNIAEKNQVAAAASLGETQISAQEIAGLSIGDVVCLDSPLNGPIVLRLNDISIPCKVGIKNGHFALQVLSPYFTKVETPVTREENEVAAAFKAAEAPGAAAPPEEEIAEEKKEEFEEEEEEFEDEFEDDEEDLEDEEEEFEDEFEDEDEDKV